MATKSLGTNDQQVSLASSLPCAILMQCPRYCFPATAFESLAVSLILTIEFVLALAYRKQTDLNTEKCAAPFFYCRGYIRPYRRSFVMGELSGKCFVLCCYQHHITLPLRKVQEISIDYSECAEKAPRKPRSEEISDRVTSSFKSSGQSAPTWQRFDNGNVATCRLIFDIPDAIGPPVFMYYRLTNFYQNHRRYVKSLDVDQLKGKAVDNKTLDGGSCDPLKLDPSGKAYYPCGLIANSQFNDTINSPQLLSAGVDPETYVMTNKGIAWDSDKELIKKTQYKPGQVVPPPNWRDRYPNNYEDGIPDLHENEEFMVWMRTAALPTFSKLARRNDSTSMAKGTYQLDIALRMASKLSDRYSVY